MKHILILIAITLLSCSKEEPYFIEAIVSSESDDIIVITESSNGVKEIIVSYEYKLSPGELTQSKSFKAPQKEQRAVFYVDKQSQLNYLFVTVVDSKGNTKTINL